MVSLLTFYAEDVPHIYMVLNGYIKACVRQGTKKGRLRGLFSSSKNRKNSWERLSPAVTQVDNPKYTKTPVLPYF